MKLTESAGGVVINSEGKILVVNQHGTSWSLPKGHIERGESLVDTVKREIYEESGIKKLEIIKKLGSYERYRIDEDGGIDRTELKTITMFLLTTTETKLKPADPKHPEAIWLNKNEVAKYLTHPKDKEFFSGAVKKI